MNMEIFTFYSWLLEQTGRDDNIGRLAQHLKSDECFPKRASLERMLSYLKDNHPPFEALRTLKEAFRECKKVRQKLLIKRGLAKRPVHIRPENLEKWLERNPSPGLI